MTSERQIAANRRNAQRSTGPRSRAGKARVSRNALKHGLAATLMDNPALVEEVSALATTLVGGASGDTTALALASAIAEAELDLIRVRMARVELLNRLAADPATFEPKLPKWLTPDWIEQVLEAVASDDPITAIAKSNIRRLLMPVANQPEKQALVLARAAPQLLRLDRYERRAMSRRRTAIRALDRALADRARRARAGPVL